MNSVSASWLWVEYAAASLPAKQSFQVFTTCKISFSCSVIFCGLNEVNNASKLSAGRSAHCRNIALFKFGGRDAGQFPEGEGKIFEAVEAGFKRHAAGRQS